MGTSVVFQESPKGPRAELIKAMVDEREASQTAKTAAETARAGAETAKGESETARDGAVAARSAAETARGGAETARAGAETAQAGAVSARAAAEAARDGAIAAAITLNATAYATVANLPGSPAANARGYVYADPTPAQNGLWFWTGAIWQKDQLGAVGRTEYELALSEKANSAALQQANSARIAEIRAGQARVLLAPDDRRGGIVSIVGNKIRFPRLRVSRPDSSDVISPDESPVDINPVGDYWEMDFSTLDTANLAESYTYWIDMADDPKVLKQTVGLVQRFGLDQIPVGWSQRGRFYNPHGLQVLYDVGATAPAMRADMHSRGLLRVEGMRAAVEGLATADERWGRVPWVSASPGPIQIGGPLASEHLILQAAGVQADCSYMPVGTTALILFTQGGTVFAGHGKTWAGQGTNHTANVPSGAVVRVTRISQSAGIGTLIEAVAGGPLSFSGGAEPVRAASIALAGQSPLELGFSYGLPAGFARAARDANWMQAAINPDIYWIEGAVGGASLTEGVNRWWDIATNGDGPSLIAWKAVVSAAVASGQPAPSLTIFSLGESDAGTLQGGVRSQAVYQAAVQSVFASISSHLFNLGALNPQILVAMTGSWEDEVYRRGMTAVRWAFQKAIAAVSNAHFACDSYDLPRPFEDIHLSGVGYWHLGWRLARAYGNIIVGQSNDLGPQMVSARLRSATDFRTAVVELPEGVVIPPGDHGPDEARGPYPWGFGIFAGPLLEYEREIIWARVDRTARTIELYTAVNLTGAVVTPLAGFGPDHRSGHTIRDDASHGRMRGLPLQSTVSAPLVV